MLLNKETIIIEKGRHCEEQQRQSGRGAEAISRAELKHSNIRRLLRRGSCTKASLLLAMTEIRYSTFNFITWLLCVGSGTAGACIPIFSLYSPATGGAWIVMSTLSFFSTSASRNE